MTLTNITLKRGDDFIATITLKVDNTPVDITGYTFFFTVKKRNDNVVNDSTALIQKIITSHTDPTNGITTLDLSNTDTDITPGEYFYDVQYKDTDNRITTITESPLFIVNADTTRRIT